MYDFNTLPPSLIKYPYMSPAVHDPAGIRDNLRHRVRESPQAGERLKKPSHQSPGRGCAPMNRRCLASVNEPAEGRLSPLAVLAPPFADSTQFLNYSSL